jgi:hypothetical protein
VDVSILKQLASTMVEFEPRFDIMPGTKARAAEVAHASLRGRSALDHRRIVEKRLGNRAGKHRRIAKIRVHCECGNAATV